MNDEWTGTVFEYSEAEFRAICDLTLELTKLRVAGCAHLAIENFAPELFQKLMAAWRSGSLE